MTSVKNPNGPSKNRLVARASKRRKQQKTVLATKRKNRVENADSTRGARDGVLMPTSGPNAALSAKKRRKLERKMGHAIKRQMEADGEVIMKEVTDATIGNGEEMGKAEDEDEAREDMEVNDDQIS